jgi:hypothetical protein
MRVIDKMQRPILAVFHKSCFLQDAAERATLSRGQNKERSVRTDMIHNFAGTDVDDMIFGSAESVASER